MLRLSDRSRSVRPDRVWWRSEDWSRKLLPPHTFRRGGPTVGAWLTDWMISVSSCWKDWHVKLSGRQSTRPFWNPVSTYQVHNSNQMKSSHSSYQDQKITQTFILTWAGLLLVCFVTSLLNQWRCFTSNLKYILSSPKYKISILSRIHNTLNRNAWLHDARGRFVWSVNHSSQIIPQSFSRRYGSER